MDQAIAQPNPRAASGSSTRWSCPDEEQGSGVRPARERQARRPLLDARSARDRRWRGHPDVSAGGGARGGLARRWRDRDDARSPERNLRGAFSGRRQLSSTIASASSTRAASRPRSTIRIATAGSSRTTTCICSAKGTTRGSTTSSAPTVIKVGAADGTHFAVWAPNAERVSVVGDFNGWDGRLHPMRSLGASGVWEIFHSGRHRRAAVQVRDPVERARRAAPEVRSVRLCLRAAAAHRVLRCHAASTTRGTTMSG